MINCGKRARPPKKNAKQKVWDDFFERFDWKKKQPPERTEEELERDIKISNYEQEYYNFVNPPKKKKKTLLEKLNILLQKKKPVKKKSYHDN